MKLVWLVSSIALLAMIITLSGCAKEEITQSRALELANEAVSDYEITFDNVTKAPATIPKHISNFIDECDFSDYKYNEAWVAEKYIGEKDIAGKEHGITVFVYVGLEGKYICISAKNEAIPGIISIDETEPITGNAVKTSIGGMYEDKAYFPIWFVLKNQKLCGDNVCDEKEKANPNLCPEDCGSTGKSYYVAKVGNDNNDGSENNPWLTIQKAANSVQPGDTVYVKGGTYKESIEITKSGEKERRIIFSNFNKDKVNVLARNCHGFYVEADYITIRGFNISNAYYRENANCPDWTASGITTHRSNNIFKNNEISNSMYGILLRANVGDDDGVIWPTEGSNIVKNNYIHNTEYGAVRVKRSNNNIVENNKFYYNNQKLEGSGLNDKYGNLLFYVDAPLVFYCLNGLRIENNEIYEPKFGPAILELDMVTRTPQAPSMAPNPDKTQCPLNLNNVVIKNNTVYKTQNQKYPIILTLGRDFALGSGHVIDSNVWFNGNPGSKIIEWGYNFWHDNDKDDGIIPKVWTLQEFQKNTGYDLNSKDTNPN